MPPLQRTRSKPKQQQKLNFQSYSRPLSFTPSFSLFSTPSSRNSPAPQEKAKAKQVQEQPAEHSLWTDKHAPTTTNELAIHKKKVKDVENWLKESFHGSPSLQKHRRLLALTGSSGSGKTATIKALSAATELDFEILEWQNESSHPTNEYIAGSASISERFADFLARAGRYPTLNLAASAPEPLALTSTSSSSNSSHASSSAQRIILIKDLPNIHHLPTKTSFNAAIEQFITRTLSTQGGNVPIVMIISESTPRDDDERWAGESVRGDGWRGRTSAVMDVRTVLGQDIRRHPAYTEIRLNPVAPTILLKGLKRIVDLEFTPEKKRGKTAAARNGARPPADVVSTIAEGGSGDIRAAINCLQFICGISAKVQAAVVAETKRDASRRIKASSRSRNAAKLLAMTSGRESSLALFHAVGRVLYNKRVGDLLTEEEERKLRRQNNARGESDEDLGDDDNDGLSEMRERLAKAMSSLYMAEGHEEEASPVLPTYLEHLQRRESRVDVQGLWTDMPIDPSMFQLYIHQNYTAFTTEIEQCSEIIDWISCADAIRSSREQYRSAPLVSYYNFLITVQATLLHLPSPVPRKNQILSKAAFWEVGRKGHEMNDYIDDAKTWLGYTRQVTEAMDYRSDAGLGDESYSTLLRSDRTSLSTEILPLLCKISPDTVPRYFTQVARLRFEWAGISETSERNLDEHEIEIEEPGQSSQPRSNGSKEQQQREKEEKMYLSDDDISDF